ncbi:MAG: LysR family transcriptional regulator [Acidobacteriota bacterium]|nr:LysR family transcriptional regulator [Acidobacteriota bacterium]
MDFSDLEVLAVVADEKNFSRAAKVLRRTQPAVSQAIKRLETEVGEVLFDRSSKEGLLTPAGEVLLDYTRQMLNLRRTAKTAVRDLKQMQRGKVTISANEHTVFYLLPIIAEFKKRFPLIKIHVQRGVASRIPKEVMARDVELGVVSFHPKDKSVKALSVGTDELILIVSPMHHLADKESVSITELGIETFIAHNAPSPYREMVISKFAKQNVNLNIAVEMPSLEAIKKLVALGVGIALVPKLTAREEIESGQVVGLSVKEMKFLRELNIIYRRNGVLSHAAKVFLQMVKELSPQI